MANANTPINSEGQSNLLRYTYLHSKTYNFNRALNLVGKNTLFNQDRMRKQAIDKLESIIDKLKMRELEFYKSFNNPEIHDITSFNKVLSESLPYVKVLQKLNNEKFINSVTTSFEKKIIEVATEEFNLKAENYINDKELREAAEKLIIAGINDMRRRNKKQGEIVREISSAKGEVFKNFVKEHYEKISDQGAKDLRQFVWDKIEDFLMEEFSTKPNGTEVWSFVRKAYNTITSRGGTMDMSEPEINTSDRSNVVGLIGELNSAALLNAMTELYQNKAKGSYIGDMKDTTGRKLPVDFLIDKYGFQSKNTLNENPHTFKIQEEIKIDTLADRLDGADRDLMKYLMVNIVFLQKNALDENLNVSTAGDIIAFVNELINSYADMLMSTEIDETRYNYSNLFFIFKSKYLIPISVMLEGSLDLIKKDSNTSKLENGIGYINPNLGKSFKVKNPAEFSRQYALEMYEEKHEERIASDLPSNVLTYGGSLGPYGGERGQDIIDLTKIKINYTMTLDNLKNIEKKIGIF